MYVCICRAVTDHEIRDAVADGTRTLRGLRKRLGCTGQCGKCAPQVREIRNEVLGERGEEALPAALCP
ncbi:MAG: (2Fe-2S)-binding protein [Gammaproteobacteria bacterium]|jgi:bacterioferritin-associated ferredoxin